MLIVFVAKKSVVVVGVITSSYHCILYTQGKCLHRHLFPARTFKDMKYCGNFIKIDFYYLPHSMSLLP